MTLAAAVCAALAVWLLVPAGRHARAHLIDGPSGEPDDPIASFRRWLGARDERERGRVREIAALAALSAELNAGQPPASALVAADPERLVWP